MRLVTLWNSALLFLGVFAGTSAQAFLGDLLFLPPHDDYQRLETANFKVVYPAALREQALKSADLLEEAHATLSPAFEYAPGHKCTIILTDNVDYANGVTSAVGLQGIVLFMTMPEPYSSIGEYENWLRDLIIHEYAHYLTLEQTRGLFQFSRYLFGNLLFPNHLWPAWLSEGMAVYAETRFTRQGRGHGSYYSTITRDGLARGALGTWNWLEYNQLSGPLPEYPFGEAPYYAGYGIIDQMQLEFGAKSPARYAEESSWRIPFFLDGALKNSTGHQGASFRLLWENWVARMRKELGPELDWLKTNGTPAPAFVTPEGESGLGARLSPDQSKLAYIKNSGHDRPSIHIYDFRSKKHERVTSAVSGAGLAWSSDSSVLYFAKADYSGPYALYSDLYKYDGSITRLTRGARAKDPGVCGATKLVYATTAAGHGEVRLFDLKSEESATVYRASESTQVSNPRCDNSGRTLYFSEHSTEPLDYVVALELATGKSRKLFGGQAAGFGALFPEPAANGDIYFTRVQDSYYDLARWDSRTNSISALARSTGGYWLPSLAGDKMAVSYVSSKGIRAAVIDVKELKKNESLLSSAISKMPKAPAPSRSEAKKGTPDKTQILSESSYSVFSSLTPRLWSPYLVLGDRYSQVGATVLGWDDIDQLEYTLFAWYDSVPRAPEGLFSTYHRFGTFKLGIGASSQITDYVFNAADQRIYDEERKIAVSLSRPFPGAYWHFTPTVMAEWARTYRDGDFGRRVFEAERRLGASLSFDSRESYRQSISPEEGVLARVEGRRFFAGLFRASKGLAELEGLVPIFPRHGVLSLNLFAAVSPSPVFEIPESIVKVGGKGTLGDLDPPLRGYPLGNFETRRAGIVQAEYRLPVAQLFRGFENFPFFFNNIGLFGFYDGAKLQIEDNKYGPWISSAGGGMLINTTLGYAFPLQVRIEFAHGFKQNLNGQDYVGVQVGF